MSTLAREGEWGWVHTLDTGIDHSATYVSAELHYRSPLGVVTDKTCDVVDAAAGEYGWTVTSGFFTPGKWTVQLSVNLGVVSGIRKLRTPVSFLIGESGE